MPTDVLGAFAVKHAAERNAAADQACLLLIPLIACLASIILAVGSPAFAAGLSAIGPE